MKFNRFLVGLTVASIVAIPTMASPSHSHNHQGEWDKPTEVAQNDYSYKSEEGAKNSGLSYLYANEGERFTYGNESDAPIICNTGQTFSYYTTEKKAEGKWIFKAFRMNCIQ